MSDAGVRGALVRNVLRFVRLLRGAGMSLGPGAAIEAVRAVEAVGITRREDFYWALHAVLVSGQDEHDLFDQAFFMFWREPAVTPELPEGMVPGFPGEPPDRPDRPRTRRLAESAGHERRAPSARSEGGEEVDVRLTFSARERLRSKDFEQMSADELRRAREVIRRMQLDIHEVATRRWRSGQAGRVDMRATLRASLRSGHGHIPLRWKKRVHRPPALVALCDISGSMERYSRVLLHFLHALAAHRGHVAAFTFGTRLTNVTRYLRHGDPDDALVRMGTAVRDWSGGTRIGAALSDFNLLWSRRVLGQGAVVLLITDGLDREGGVGIRREARRLRLSCRRLIWLNPLLRFEGFEPKAAGIRALLPEVDELRPVHDLGSLEQLAEVLSRPRRRAGALAARAP